MSHELRTPLNSVIGFGQLLEMTSDRIPSRRASSYISKAGRHLLDLINEVLDISRIETGTMTLSLEPVSLETLVLRSVSTSCAPQVAQERGIEMINRVGRDRTCAGIASDSSRCCSTSCRTRSSSIATTAA